MDGKTRINIAGKMSPLASLLLLLLFVFSGCEKKSPTQKAPEEAKPAWNGTGEGFRTSRNDRKEVEINLKEIRLATIPEDYDKWGNIVFSANGQKVFYIGIKGGKKFVVIGSPSGEKAGNAYEDVTFMVVSPDGQRVAYGGKRGKKKYLVVDNKELKALYHEEVAPGSFSPDSRLVACEVGSIKEKKWFIVVSDGEKEVYRSPSSLYTYRPPVFSPDGRLLLYELKGDKKEEKITFFADARTGKVIKERIYDLAERYLFSADGSRLVYHARKKAKDVLVLQDFVLNQEREILLPYTGTGWVALSPDGKKIIYAVIKEGRHFLVISHWESPDKREEKGPYEGIAPAIFSPDSRIVAYRAMKEGKWHIVVGDKEGKGYDGIGDAPVFSPDGAKIAYPAMKNSGGGQQDRRRMMDGKWVMVISPVGKPAAVRECPVYDMVVTPVFSPDGKYVVYRARKGTMEKGKRFIVIADSKGNVLRKVRSVMRSGSRHSALTANRLLMEHGLEENYGGRWSL